METVQCEFQRLHARCHRLFALLWCGALSQWDAYRWDGCFQKPQRVRQLGLKVTVAVIPARLEFKLPKSCCFVCKLAMVFDDNLPRQLTHVSVERL